MVEEQVEPEILSSHFERHSAPDEGEANTQLGQELTQMCEESLFEVAFLGFV